MYSNHVPLHFFLQTVVQHIPMCLINFRHHLKGDAFKGSPNVVKKVRQCCLVSPDNGIANGYTQAQLAEVLGVDQSLVCRTAKKTKQPLSPYAKNIKRQKRSDAVEVSNPELVLIIKQFWVCTIYVYHH